MGPRKDGPAGPTLDGGRIDCDTAYGGPRKDGPAGHVIPGLMRHG